MKENLTRHEEENSSKDEWNDAANDAESENVHASADSINEENTDRYHELEVGAERPSNLLLSDFTNVDGRSDAESSTGDADKDTSSDKHAEVLSPNDQPPSDGKGNDETQH